MKAFTETEEETAEVLVGETHDAILTAGSTAIVYGDGGAGKTTLTIDAVAHWGAGRPWLGLITCRPLRILLVENEGPREPFRRKVNRKRSTWRGGNFDDNVFVLEEPWTYFTFALDDDPGRNSPISYELKRSMSSSPARFKSSG